MGIIKRAGDLVYTFRFLRLLTTSFRDTEAFKVGIIDDKGKRLKSFNMNDIENRDKYREYYTPFHRLVFNIKKIMAKAPGGDSKFASYAAALFLLKEEFGVTEKKIKSAMLNANIDITDIMTEGSQWFLLDDGRLSPGRYKVKHEKVISDTLDEYVRPKDWVVVGPKAYPIGNIFGLNIYEATHKGTNRKVHITVDELMT